MKRYVKEFANDVIRTDAKNKLMRDDIRDKRKTAIEYVLTDYKAGLISEREAVKMIAEQ